MSPRPGMVRHRPNEMREMVDQNSASWNRVVQWMRQIGQLRHGA